MTAVWRGATQERTSASWAASRDAWALEVAAAARAATAVLCATGLGDARGLRLTLSDGQLFGADWTAVAGRCGGAEQEPESKETDEEDGSGERSPPVVSEPHQTSRLQTSRAISLMGSLVERFLTRLRS